MTLRLIDNKDFWSGVMLIAIGAGAVYVARDYALGTTLRMGPGYFPTALGALIGLAVAWLTINLWANRRERAADASP